MNAAAQPPIGQQLFQCDGRHFQLAQGVKAPAVLHVVQVALDKGKAALKLRADFAFELVLAVFTTGQEVLEFFKVHGYHGGIVWAGTA